MYLRREPICTATDTVCSTAAGKSFVCAHDWHVTAYGTVYAFSCIYTRRAMHPPPLPISHGTSSFQTIVGRLF